ncbi:MAG: hypothetical protein ACJ73E_00625 [Mycobacteriales bacterium]
MRTPSRVVRDLAAARRQRESDDLRRRAAWAGQARRTPTLEDWIDVDDLAADLAPRLAGRR